MSDRTVVNSRNRRKATRTEGPPVHDGDAAIAEDTTVKVTVAAATVPDPAEAAPANAGDAVTETVRLDKDADSEAAAETVTEKIAVEDEPVIVVVPPGEDTEDAAAESDPTAEDVLKRTRNWPMYVLGTAAVACLIALVASLVFWVPAYRTADKDQQLRADYTQTAKQAVLNITTIKVDSVKDDINRVLSVASGQLKDEYSSRSDAYADVIKSANVKATGEVVETAIESYDTNSAQVLVAAKQSLTNAGSPDPQQRVYRFRVTIVHDGDHYTAAKLEFVA
ncbi:hypothetical protein [Nocardia heshunensis]